MDLSSGSDATGRGRTLSNPIIETPAPVHDPGVSIPSVYSEQGCTQTIEGHLTDERGRSDNDTTLSAAAIEDTHISDIDLVFFSALNEQAYLAEIAHSAAPDLTLQHGLSVPMQQSQIVSIRWDRPHGLTAIAPG